MVKTLVAIAVGAVLGTIASRYLFVGSWLSLILWGIAGLLIGLWCKKRNQAMVNGAVFGFVVAFVFMLTGYSGSATVISRLPFFAILGIIGAMCGFALGVLGFLAGRFIRKGGTGTI